MKQAIEVMEDGFCEFHEKKVLQPLRTILNTAYGVRQTPYNVF